MALDWPFDEEHFEPALKISNLHLTFRFRKGKVQTWCCCRGKFCRMYKDEYL
jgi:hypothetical protein